MKTTTYWVTCKLCKEKHIIKAVPQDIENWMEGALIQDALPYLTTDERELLITGLCPECWYQYIGGDEE